MGAALEIVRDDMEPIEDLGLVVAAGIGDGTIPAELRKLTTAMIAAYDPRADDIEVTPTERCFVTSSLTSLRGFLREVLPNVVGGINAAVDGEFTGDVAEFRRAYDEALEASMPRHIGGAMRSADRTEAMLSALPNFLRHKPVNYLRGFFAGVPGIVVGAGPSLDSQIEALKAAQGRALIMCVNTSLPALEAAGIQPDFCVVCEAKPVARTLTSCSLIESTIMVPGLHVHADTYAMPWKAIAPALSLEGMFGMWATKTLGLTPSHIGGSSACLAAGLLHLFGCDPIVLVGCDCAPQNGQLYSSASAFAGTTVEYTSGSGSIHKSDSKLGCEDVGAMARVSSMPDVEVWGWDHKSKIRSILIYDGLRQWFEESAELFAGRRLVNSSVGGAHILGWEHVELSEIGDLELLPADIRDTTIRVLDQCPSTVADGVLMALGDQIESADRITETSRRGVKLMLEALGLRRTMAEALGEDPFGPTWQWGRVRIDKAKGIHTSAFDVFAGMFGEHAENSDLSDLASRGVEIMAEAVKAQEEIASTKGEADLVDSWAWGRLDLARRNAESRPAFEVFLSLFAELERSAVEAAARMRTTKQELMGNG